MFVLLFSILKSPWGRLGVLVARPDGALEPALKKAVVPVTGFVVDSADGTVCPSEISFVSSFGSSAFVTSELVTGSSVTGAGAV